ncbi:MAG TPA: HAD-IA family hydrolase [Streptosporangiaceae bacterium]
MLKAVFFDFDGVIAETEPLQLRAYNAVLEQRGCPEMTEEQFSGYVGLSTAVIVTKLKQSLKLSDTPEQLVAEKTSRYQEIVTSSQLSPRPGLVPLLEELRSNNWKLAVASSSSYDVLRLLLTKLGIGPYFSRLFSVESVAHGKPSPDVYKFSIAELKVATNRAVAIEDSPAGLESAKQAGIACVAVPSQYTRHLAFPQADLSADSLAKLSHRTIASLIRLEIGYVPKSASGYSEALYDVIMDASSARHDVIKSHHPRRDESLHAQLTVLQHIQHRLPDVLIVVPIDEGGEIRRVLERLHNRGVGIVTVDADLGPPPPRRQWWSVTADFLEGGRRAGEVMLDAIGYRGSIGIISGPRGLRPSDERRLGFLDFVSDYVPNVRLEQIVYTDWYRGQAQDAVENWFTSGVTLDGIFCANDNLAMGAADAIRSASANQPAESRMPVVVGFDGIEEVYEYVIDGRVLASVDVDIGLQGLRAWQLATGEPEDLLHGARHRVVIKPHILSRGEILRIRERTRCFISYAHEDRELVERIDRTIRGAGFSVVVDIRESAGGGRFAGDFRLRITESDVMVLIVSSASLASAYVADELHTAVYEEANRRLTIIPVLADDVALPAVIRDHLCVDFRDVSSADVSCRQLIHAILAARRRQER